MEASSGYAGTARFGGNLSNAPARVVPFRQGPSTPPSRTAALLRCGMRSNSWRPHLRQGATFVLVGLAQLVLDSAVFVGTTAAGVPVAPGNVLGRVSGALLGYWLNGRITFAANGEARLGRGSLARFLVVWLAMTAISTAGMAAIASHFSIGHAWFAKPLLDGLLALAGFFLLRHWVYR
jgi:putative flippase GtrA